MESLREQLTKIVYQQVFTLCDHQEDITGDEAGIIATGVQQAFNFYYLLATEWIEVESQENAATMLTHDGTTATFLGSFGRDHNITFYVLDGAAWKIDRTDGRNVVCRSESGELLRSLQAQFQARRW